VKISIDDPAVVLQAGSGSRYIRLPETLIAPWQAMSAEVVSIGSDGISTTICSSPLRRSCSHAGSVRKSHHRAEGKRNGVRYHHTYFRAEYLDLDVLFQYPTDQELVAASMVAYKETW